MGQEKGTCRFCAADDTWINDEHVFPKWLGKKIVRKMSSPRMQMQRGPVPYRPMGISSINITARCACKVKCNNGWMRQLEEDVRPLMLPMVMTGARTEIGAARARLLATWLVKTAMAYEFTNHMAPPYFTDKEREHLRVFGEPPPGDVRVWLGRYSGRRPAGLTSQYSRAHGARLGAPGYTFSLRAGFLVFQVLGHRHGQGTAIQQPKVNGVPSSVLLPLWPTEPTNSMIWPPTLTLNDDLLVAFEERFWTPAARQKLEAARWTKTSAD